jgi:Fur family peroxide stress response transcriptional regulator
MPSISLDTVYRTLHTLEEHGLIARVESLSDKSRFDANARPHPHFLCTACGAIHDMPGTTLDALSLPEGTALPGRPDSLHVEIRGVCRDCLAGAAKDDGRGNV